VYAALQQARMTTRRLQELMAQAKALPAAKLETIPVSSCPQIKTKFFVTIILIEITIFASLLQVFS
jgi:hypothetical protein